MNVEIKTITDAAYIRADIATPVVFSFSIDAGNEKVGATSWGKKVDSLDLSKCKSAHGFVGDWLEKEGSNVAPEGTLIVLGGRGGSWKNTSSCYVLARVKAGAELNHKYRYQTFHATGLELIETDGHFKASVLQDIIEECPELAPGVGSVLLPLFYEALKLMPAHKVVNAETSGGRES